MMIADIARGRRRLDGAPLGKSARRRTSTVTGIARKTILCDEGRKRWAARRRLRCRSDVAKSVLAVRRDDGDRAHCTVAGDDPVPSYIYIPFERGGFRRTRGRRARFCGPGTSR
ncbi:hypothetical protein Trydic_g15343 [Trypoxylus dichotomus]